MTVTAAFDSYWKLDEYKTKKKSNLVTELTAAGYQSISSIDKELLVLKQHRIDRGLLIYDKCTDDELEKFTRDRHIQLQQRPPTSYTATPALNRAHDGKKKLWRTSAITLLEGSDEELTFDKFMDLPGELRDKVHEMYIEDFGNLLETTTQPPLARTSRLMKREVLPLFYGLCTFVIKLSRDPRFPHLGFRPTTDTSLFLLNLAPGQVGNLRRLQLVPEDRVTSKDSNVHCKITVDVTTPNRVHWDFVSPKLQSSARKVVMNELILVLKRVEMKSERRRVKIQDIFALRKAVEAGLG